MSEHINVIATHQDIRVGDSIVHGRYANGGLCMSRVRGKSPTRSGGVWVTTDFGEWAIEPGDMVSIIRESK